jgi:hypothetical protein
MDNKTTTLPKKKLWNKFFSKISCYNLSKVIDPKITESIVEPKNTENVLESKIAGPKVKPKIAKKKKSIPLTLKRKVWNTYIGENIGKTVCLCCKLTEITQLSFSCGHIISEFNGGEIRLDNLKPICVSCNSSMGTTNMDEFIEKFGL